MAWISFVFSYNKCQSLITLTCSILKVCLSLGASIAFSVWLTSLRLSMKCPGVSLALRNDSRTRWILCIIIDQLLWIFHPIFLSLQEAYLIIKNQMILKLKDVHDERYIQNLEKLKQLTLYLKLYKKMELNLETIFQLTGKLILIALVESQTRTTQGLLTIFDEKDIFGMPAKLFIALSIVFSFASFSFAQTAGIAGFRVYFPLKSRILIGGSALLSSVVRVMIFVLYFSPCLGLWNLLRHYQG